MSWTTQDGLDLLALERIKSRIREVSNFPKPGVAFKDISPALLHAHTFELLIDLFAQRYRPIGLTAIAGVDARGFILGGALARALNIGFIPIRKAGKLPGPVARADYALEYGTATIEVQRDLFAPGTSVVIMDDLIATGGTLIAAHGLLTQLGAHVHEVAAVIDLPQLGGSEKLRQANITVFSLLQALDD